MQIQLPSAAEVAHAVEIWSAGDSLLPKLLTRYGDPAPALRHYGLVLWEGGNLQSASQALTGAAALAPGDARVWSDLSGVFHGLGRPGEAIACAEESLMRDPAQPQIWLQLGAVHSAAGDAAATVDAYKRALEFDDGLVEAWVGLGLAYFNARRFQDAIMPFQTAIRRGKTGDAGVQGCLGQALQSVGDFAGAASAFTIASTLQPDNRAFLLKRVRAQFAVDAIHGPAEVAVAACTRFPLTVDELEKTVHDGFHLLSAYGHEAAAIRLGAYRLARAPDDMMQAYLLASLKGETMERAPEGYIVSFFDKFAEEFEHKLVDVLGYRVPGDLADLTQDVALRTGRSIARILDLGCGTGLVGSHLVGMDRVLTGVDLSPRMLDKARSRGCYESLVEAEAVAYLAANTTRYDLVVAADMLIYFGDLSAVFKGVSRALGSGGLFALSIETSDDKAIVHLPSGRFAHGLAYVERAATDAGLTLLEVQPTMIRLEANVGTPGALLLMAKA